MNHPKFATTLAWQQAEVLMQPVFIRLIDNLRKQLDESPWQGTYEEVPIWAEPVSEEVRFQVMQLRTELANASPPEAAEIQQALDQLPAPHPSYQLQLRQQDHCVTVDLWDLCYQICFQNYDASTNTTQPVEIDLNLLDEAGEVEWNHLDDKARQVVAKVFADLPGGAGLPDQPV